jgi:hypothetical protein
MASELRLLEQTVELSEVTDVIVTVIAADVNAGDHYRDIRFFGTPPEGTETIPMLFTIRIRSDDLLKLKITVPESEF